MKILIFAVVFSSFMAFNNSAGPGGNLLSNVPDNLTDCCGGKLFAR